MRTGGTAQVRSKRRARRAAATPPTRRRGEAGGPPAALTPHPPVPSDGTGGRDGARAPHPRGGGNHCNKKKHGWRAGEGRRRGCHPSRLPGSVARAAPATDPFPADRSTQRGGGGLGDVPVAAGGVRRPFRAAQCRWGRAPARRGPSAGVSSPTRFPPTAAAAAVVAAASGDSGAAVGCRPGGYSPTRPSMPDGGGGGGAVVGANGEPSRLTSRRAPPHPPRSPSETPCARWAGRCVERDEWGGRSVGGGYCVPPRTCTRVSESTEAVLLGSMQGPFPCCTCTLPPLVGPRDGVTKATDT